MAVMWPSEGVVMDVGGCLAHRRHLGHADAPPVAGSEVGGSPETMLVSPCEMCITAIRCLLPWRVMHLMSAIPLSPLHL